MKAPCLFTAAAFATAAVFAQGAPRRNAYARFFHDIEKKDGTLIGECCFKGVSPNGSTEIGYGISEEYQGQGYATDAVNAVTKPYAPSVHHLNGEESVFEFETTHPRLSSMPT